MDERSSPEDALIVCRQMVDRLLHSLPDKIEAGGLTLKSKLPFKVLSLRELLLHRTTALSEAAVEQFEKRNFVAGIVLTRSVMETAAMHFQLERHLNKFLRTSSTHKLDSFLMRMLMASRTADAKHSAIDVTSFVDAVDKHVPSFRDTYNALSEYVHPNWAGVLGGFGAIEPETHTLHLGQQHGRAAQWSGVNALAGTLEEFVRRYNGMVPLLRQLNEHFEQTPC